jgi:hypothetical protein
MRLPPNPLRAEAWDDCMVRDPVGNLIRIQKLTYNAGLDAEVRP